jgi:hypothetical protein
LENLGILVYFTAIGNILWQFGTFFGHLVYFPRFGILYKEKNLATLFDSVSGQKILRRQPQTPKKV